MIPPQPFISVVITSGCPGDVAAAIVERCPAGGVLGVELGQEQRLGIALADLLALQDLLGAIRFR